MPRTKRAHHHEITVRTVDSDVPLDQRRAVYCRLSDDDPNSVSIEHQLQAAERYAASTGATITNVYTDWRTGLDPDRIALKQLIADAHAGKHSGIIFYDHYRLHRGLKGAYTVARLHEQLPKYTFEATVGGYDIGKMWLFSGMSGEELETTKRRTMEQRRRRASNGELMSGKLPYWLTRDPATRRPALIGDRSYALRQATLMYANGTPMRQVAQWMTTNAPGPSRWSSSRLREAFRNPALWGALDYGRSLVVTEKRGDELVVVGRAVNPKAIPFRVPALIHKTELERAQCQVDGGCDRDAYPSGDTLDGVIRSQNQRAGGRPYTLEHPLRRRVVCPCGWRMGFRQKRYRDHDADFGYLICARTKQRGVSVVKDYPDCPVGSVSTRKLWPEVQALLIDSIRNPERVVSEVQQAILAEAAEEARSVAEEASTLEELTRQLSDLDERENRLYERWDGSQISEAVYRTQSARISSERRELEEAKRQLLSRRLVVEKAKRATASLQEGLAEAAELPFSQLNLEAWARLVDALVQDVVLDAEGRPSLRWRRGA